MTPRTIDLVASGLAFPEGPRWHGGNLWFSDMHDHKVWRLDASGALEFVVDVPNAPSGLGWLPDGRLLVVSMHDRSLLRLDVGGLVLVADLAPYATADCNDMVVDRVGRAYVGNFGDASAPPAPAAPAKLVLVEPDGTTRVAADDLLLPNGAVITPDGRRLIIAETRADPPCLTVFSVAEDGSLSDRRTFAAFRGEMPDGICLDAEGAVWVASPFTNEVLRVVEGGEVTDRIPTGDEQPYACALGGPEGRDLFLCTARTWIADEARRTRLGAIRRVEVDVPGAA
jgi:sugar lactone lactonase YvrE